MFCCELKHKHSQRNRSKNIVEGMLDFEDA